MGSYSKLTYLSGRRRRASSLVILAVAFFVLAAAPGAALADSAAEQYIEPQIPTVPSDKDGSKDRDRSSGNAARDPGNGPNSSDPLTSKPSGTRAGSGVAGADGGPDRPAGKSGKRDPNKSGKAQGGGNDSDNSPSDGDADEDAAAAVLSGAGGGSGGSSLELLLGLLVLAPLVAAGGYYLWQRYPRGVDEETSARLRKAVSGD